MRLAGGEGSEIPITLCSSRTPIKAAPSAVSLTTKAFGPCGMSLAAMSATWISSTRYTWRGTICKWPCSTLRVLEIGRGSRRGTICKWPPTLCSTLLQKTPAKAEASRTAKISEVSNDSGAEDLYDSGVESGAIDGGEEEVNKIMTGGGNDAEVERTTVVESSIETVRKHGEAVSSALAGLSIRGSALTHGNPVKMEAGCDSVKAEASVSIAAGCDPTKVDGLVKMEAGCFRCREVVASPRD
ncbi:uncharacterized protein LOC112343270 [Selaginella moellendorffii]|uniref:uncharacterized protein LOC112343270 n=1 Tax=Selaginella moellendorffii TaxID=88036 RepID=UPI000D1CCF97|nr:uncharacterized protein LOC112343270 [Selaginella moellendorffii]XP_024522205.1 uncharacterized protein LOC112343270 [Selaginella moellendorffii]XP_024522206.1 uncharacterized protein LOC112343270 [Selaginella moellendorffii]XP_024522207.1 uncharacterized protein LOC112343270 [Selaginella moellendorffii]|eukprot:XP_024522204.1 uncharacterized protein LOC112343270 [Selaginella moellendorffii]